MPLNKSVGGTESSFGSFGVRKSLLSLPEIKPHLGGGGPSLVKYGYNLAEEETMLEGAIDRRTEAGNNCGKINVMRISGQSFAVQIMIDQKQNGERGIFQLFGYYGNK